MFAVKGKFQISGENVVGYQLVLAHFFVPTAENKAAASVRSLRARKKRCRLQMSVDDWLKLA